MAPLPFFLLVGYIISRVRNAAGGKAQLLVGHRLQILQIHFGVGFHSSPMNVFQSVVILDSSFCLN